MRILVCPACATENRVGALFCKGCGVALTLACEACGTPHETDQTFCDHCGARLAGTAPPSSAPAGPSTAELRHVSVLFVDLVGFTDLSESRDADDVRELLGRYFEQAKTIVARYGGTIGKFIGDAVMAVWGLPVAREDDAERAVRAGLELVEAVARFGEQVGAPDLSARAGVVTGKVAPLDDPAEGIVVGDRVNTAARVQAAADPGHVLVDEVTRQVTAASIAYEDAGEHSVKGKAQPLRLWRAIRAVARVAGARRATGIDVPFVGREAELRLVKDLFHATADRGGARLISVSGPAGVGKTRLGDELSNYLDGLAGGVLWHSGRCLSFGEGVAYWALAEMVRQRFGIAEEASADAAAASLGAGLEQWVADPDERRRVSAALGPLLGVDEPGMARDELFAGWRLFFERLSEHNPVVMVFEDLQWADDGLLEFIEQLLDWSSEHRIFVVTFARPELAERRPGWPVRVPGATPIGLEPLDDGQIEALLAGWVSSLPAAGRRRIVARAEGMPLYAVETIRSLVDRGVLVEGDGGLEPAAEIGDLDVPASLSSLLSARLDSLPTEERELVAAMAVFGGSFARSSAAALAALPEERLDDALAALVGREILTIRTDPLSPERGQYGFAQGMLRTVAYERLPRRERRPRHLAAAAHLRAAFPNDGEEVAEVIAAHLLDAYRAGPGSDDDVLRAEALAALRVAARRAATVGSPDAAERLLRSAAELAESEPERTELIGEAARMADLAGRYPEAIELFEQAAAAHREAGRERDATRLAGPIGLALGRLGRNEEAIERMRAALESLGADELDADVAALGCELGRALSATGRVEEAEAIIDRALEAAQALELTPVTARALGLKALNSELLGRFEEARILYDGASALGARDRLADRVYPQLNGANLRILRDMPDAVELCEAGVASARELGNRSAESVGLGNLMLAQLLAGRWDEVERIGQQALDSDADRPDVEFIHLQLVVLWAARGDLERARSHLGKMETWGRSDDLEARHLFTALAALIALAAGRPEEAAEPLALVAREAAERHGPSAEGVRLAWSGALEAALALGRLADAEALTALLAEQPRGAVPPLLHAELARGQAKIKAARGEFEGVEAQLREAIDDLTALRYPYFTARAETDLAAHLLEHGLEQEALALRDRAIGTLQRLGAEPALARARDLAPARAAPA
ncbi:MAG TPA: AAA family ATPase [Solirubrobacterales bacterium]|jgi:class 3 adenylate cyclase/tetratricopeptide (TPR) repeat protein